MDPSSPWAAALITIGVGAISGGLTNAIAVWMLFNPHEERGFGPFRLRGAIPKNKARLATAIGKAGVAGGKVDPCPRQDHGFMYNRNLGDPDGHVWEAFWMDPEAIPSNG